MNKYEIIAQNLSKQMISENKLDRRIAENLRKIFGHKDNNAKTKNWRFTKYESADAIVAIGKNRVNDPISYIKLVDDIMNLEWDMTYPSSSEPLGEEYILKLQADALCEICGFKKVEEELIRETESKNINCHTYTLLFWCFKSYLEVQSYVLNLHRLIGSVCVEAAINDGMLVEITDQTSPNEANILVYRKDGKITHSGLVQEVNSNYIIVKSKWGKLPAILEHELFQVPTSYGKDVRYYTVPDEEKLKAFLKEKINHAQ